MSSQQLDGSGVERAAKRGIGWSVLRQWSNRIASLSAIVVLTRLLAPNAFGLVALTSAIVGVLNTFVDFGFSTYLVQIRETSARVLNTAFYGNLVFALGLMLVVIGAAPWVATTLAAPAMTPILTAVAPTLLATAMTSVQIALLRRQLDYKGIALRSIAGNVCGAIAAIAAAVMGLGVWALVIQQLVQSFAGMVFLWNVSEWRPGLAVDVRVLPEMVRYGANLVGVNLLASIRQQGDALIIGGILSPTALGYFTIAQRILRVVLDLFGSVASGVAVPLFARMKDDRALLQRSYITGIASSMTVVGPVLAALAIVTPYGLPWIFGQQWEPAVTLAQLLTVSAVMTSIAAFDSGLLLALDMPGRLLTINLAQTATHISAMAVSAQFGLVGIGVAAAARAVFAWPLRLALLHRVCDVNVRLLATRVARVTLCACTGAAGGLAISAALSALPVIPRALAVAVTVLTLHGLMARLVARRELEVLYKFIPQRLQRRVRHRTVRDGRRLAAIPGVPPQPGAGAAASSEDAGREDPSLQPTNEQGPGETPSAPATVPKPLQLPN